MLNRIFGPLSHAESAEVVDYMLDTDIHKVQDTLERFVRGEIEPQQAIDELQVLLSNAHQALENPEIECMEGVSA